MVWYISHNEEKLGIVCALGHLLVLETSKDWSCMNDYHLKEIVYISYFVFG